MSAISEKRYGKFSIPREMLKDDLVHYIYKDMIPVKVELDYCTDNFEVIAAHPSFEPRVAVKGIYLAPVPFYEFDPVVHTSYDTDITGIVVGSRTEVISITWKKKE